MTTTNKFQIGDIVEYPGTYDQLNLRGYSGVVLAVSQRYILVSWEGLTTGHRQNSLYESPANESLAYPGNSWWVVAPHRLKLFIGDSTKRLTPIEYKIRQIKQRRESLGYIY